MSEPTRALLLPLLPLLLLGGPRAHADVTAGMSVSNDMSSSSTSATAGGVPRFILVGNYSSLDNSWDKFYDYVGWAKENPLYIGDVVIFRYLKYQSVVWQFPNKADFEACNYSNATLFANDTAGEGRGVPWVATEQPSYFAEGVFGGCEEFQQKVVIQATLGALPPNPIKAPAQIPNPYPPPPTPPAFPAPPPSAFETSSPQAGNYSNQQTAPPPRAIGTLQQTGSGAAAAMVPPTRLQPQAKGRTFLRLPRGPNEEA